LDLEVQEFLAIMLEMRVAILLSDLIFLRMAAAEAQVEREMSVAVVVAGHSLQDQTVRQEPQLLPRVAQDHPIMGKGVMEVLALKQH